jgi:HEPN domain-containing protein
MRADTQNWMALAEYDVETARHMLATGRYLYVVFLCHLALEKMLKAHVTEVTQSVPAKTHDLIYLVKKSALNLPQAYLEFVGKINNASIPTRYPDSLSQMLREYPQVVVQGYLRQTEEVLEWLKQQPSLRT